MVRRTKKPKQLDRIIAMMVAEGLEGIPTWARQLAWSMCVPPLHPWLSSFLPLPPHSPLPLLSCNVAEQKQTEQMICLRFY